MAIDFTLTPEQSELKADARKFAREVLAGVRGATDTLPTAEQRFLATRPTYEAMVAGGLLLARLSEDARPTIRRTSVSLIARQAYMSVGLSMAMPHAIGIFVAKFHKLALDA